MTENQVDLIKKMFEFNLWANTQLIELCSSLDDEQLQAEAEGVFGRIHPTLVHILRAEGGYLNRVFGARPWAEDLEWDDMSMSDLLANARLSGEKLIEVANSADPGTRHVIESQGKPFGFYNWTVLLQALYHGIEHRTQIKILLTHLGVEHSDLSAWDFVKSVSS